MRIRFQVQAGCLVVVLTVLLPLLSYGQSPEAMSYPSGLGEPRHRELFSSVFGRGGLMPGWDKGYLIVREAASMGNSNPETPSVSLYDSHGVRIRQGRIWFEGAEDVRVEFATATAAGEIIATGYARTADSLAAFYIARTDLKGNLTEVIRTGSYAAYSACSSSDGTVWSLGRDVDLDEQGADYGMLRQYDFRKGLIREVLARHSFSAHGVTQLIHPYAPGGAKLRCSNAGVSLYINKSGVYGEYVEVRASDGDLRRWPVSELPFPQAMVSEIAVTDSGKIYANIFENWEQRVSPGGSRDGFFRLTFDLDSGSAAWVMLPGTMAQGSRNGHAYLWGSDGEDLVLNSRHYGHGTVWVTPNPNP